MGVVPPFPHAFTGVAVPEPAGELRFDGVNQRTEPRVLKPAIMVFGFGAAGREGNVSSVCLGGAVFLLDEPTRDAVVGGGREIGAAPIMVLVICGAGVLPQTACFELVAVAAGLLARPFVADNAGNGSRLVPAESALPHEPCLETAERDD